MPLLMEFDCLYARGKDLRGQPLYVRREWLKDVIHGLDLVLPARRLADDGLTAWAGLLARLPQHRHERHEAVRPRMGITFEARWRETRSC